MSVYDIINEIIGNSIYILNCFLLIVFIFRFKFESNFKKIYFVLGFYLITIIFYSINNKFSLIMNNFFLIVMLLFHMFDEKPNKKIFIVLFIMFFETLLRGFAEVGLKILDIQGMFTAQIVIFIIIIIFSMITNKVFDIVISNYIDDTLWYIYMNMLIAIFAGILPLLVASSYGNSLNKRFNITILFTTLLMICASIISTVFYLKRMKENSAYKKELLLRKQLSEAENKYFESIVDEYKHLRSFRHDINGHMNVLYSLAKKEECFGVIEYIDNLRDGISTSILHRCSNVYIAATINQFLQTMEEKGILFEFTYSIIDEIHMKNVDICSLFNNLMSNAVEATIKNQKIRKITLDIQKVNCSLIIELQNTVHTNFDIKELKRGSTTKEDKKRHGIGLTNIDNVIKKYNGDIDYKLNDGVLIMNIVMLNIFDCS